MTSWSDDHFMFGARRPQSPCYKCEDREVGCHSHCEKWDLYSEEYRKDAQLRKEHKEKNSYEPIKYSRSRLREKYKLMAKRRTK